MIISSDFPVSTNHSKIKKHYAWSSRTINHCISFKSMEQHRFVETEDPSLAFKCFINISLKLRDINDDSNDSLPSAYYSLCSFAQFAVLKVSKNIIKYNITVINMKYIKLLQLNHRVNCQLVFAVTQKQCLNLFWQMEIVTYADGA